MLTPWTQWPLNAGGAVQDELAEAPFQICLRLGEVEAQHLRRDRDE
jgi:hypothetical protein